MGTEFGRWLSKEDTKWPINTQKDARAGFDPQKSGGVGSLTSLVLRKIQLKTTMDDCNLNKQTKNKCW